MEQTLGIYIHIPFCIQKCFYCDFCSFPKSNGDTMLAYVSELCRRISLAAPSAAHLTVDTVYFGGGTPTLLPLDCFERLLNTLYKSYKISNDCEITCECNPATADFAYLSKLRAMGINRLSIGLQSTDDHELTLLGRAHHFSDFLAVFSDARAAGFDNISADLMYGIPDQTVESFSKTLDALIKLSPEHISAYGLKIEDGTPFARTRDQLQLPDEETEWELYRLCGERLAQADYAKYEISNFAKIGRESRHNLRYWMGREYLGFGVAAHSFFGGERFGNSRDLSAFLAGKDITEDQIRLSAQDDYEEFIMLRLRLTRGIDEQEFIDRFKKRFFEAFPSLNLYIKHGLMQICDNKLSFTDRGFFVSNSILADLLCFEPCDEKSS